MKKKHRITVKFKLTDFVDLLANDKIFIEDAKNYKLSFTIDTISLEDWVINNDEIGARDNVLRFILSHLIRILKSDNKSLFIISDPNNWSVPVGIYYYQTKSEQDWVCSINNVEIVTY